MGLPKTFERKLFFVFGRHIWNIVGVSGFIAFLTGLILFGNSFMEESIKSRRKFFGSSYPVLESKEKYFGNKYPSLQTKEEYFGKKLLKLQTKKEYFGKDLLTDEKMKKIVIDSGKIKTYEKWLKENKGKGEKLGYKDYSNFLFTVPPNANLSDLDNLYEKYKRDSYSSYVDNNFPKGLIKKQKKQEEKYKEYKLSLSKKIKAQNQEYKQYFSKISNEQQIYNNQYENYKKSISQKQSSLENKYQKYTQDINSKNYSKTIQRIPAAIGMAGGLGVIALSSLISSVFSIERNSRKED